MALFSTASKALLFFGLSTLLLFCGGCDVYGDGYNLNVDVSKCEASGADCTEGTGASLLGINILNPRPYVVYYPSSGSTAEATKFDISGYCNEAGYTQNFIQWSLEDNSGNVLQSNQRIYQGCKRGKFLFQVGIVGSSTPTQQHKLTVEIIGVDPEGNEQTNPLAAKRTLFILAQAK